MTILSGTQMDLKFENKIIFPIVASFLLIFLLNCYLNNWLVKTSQANIVKNKKRYIILSILLFSFWTIIFVRMIEKKYKKGNNYANENLFIKQ